MMIVHIRKSSLFAAKVLYYGGLAVIDFIAYRDFDGISCRPLDNEGMAG